MTLSKTPVSAQQPHSPLQRPSNMPQPKIRKYVPPASQNNDGEDRGNRWVRPEALQYYDPLIVKSDLYAFAWLPMPMFNSQDASVFCDTRYAGDESQFDEWSYCTPFVRFAGTMKRKLTFCPYSDNPDSSDTFVSSPYAVVRSFIDQMNHERSFSTASPWWRLLNFDRSKGTGSYLKPIQKYFLMLGVMLYSVKNTLNRDAKKWQDTFTNHYDPATIGKGLVPGEKLTLLAVSSQIWNDLTKTMNNRASDGDWVYPNPCNPKQLAVFYAWNHEKSVCPVPGVSAKKDISGMSGTVAGLLYDLNGREVAREFKLPQQFLTPNGTPSQAYYDKVPLHVGETINYMSDFQMMKELAHAFADAKAIFDLAFKRTQYEEFLKDPEITAIFGATPQTYVYDGSIYTGQPVSQQVELPYQPPPMAQQHNVHTSAPATMTQAPNTHTYAPPTATLPQAPPQPEAYPVPPAPTPAPPPQSNAFPDVTTAVAAASDLPSADEVFDNQGFAVNAEGTFYLDENGAPQQTAVFLQKIDAASWNP